MDVRNCRSCGRLFNYMQGPQICQACQEDLEKKFAQVKDYVWDHREASLEQIAEENDVTIKQIKQWVREERLSFSDDSPIGIECENCGKIIKSGRFCDECKKVLENSLNTAIKKPKIEPPKKKEREKDRMRFLDK